MGPMDLKRHSKLTEAAGRMFVILMFFSVPSAIAQQSGMFVTGYYPIWSLGSTPTWINNPMHPREMNWSGLTHLIHFAVGPDSTPPYWHPATSYTTGTSIADSLELFYCYGARWNTDYHMIDTLKAYAHANNVKLLLSCGGIWGAQASAMDFITSDSSRTQVFVDAVVDFVLRNGYDGVEIDYEPPPSRTQMSLLTSIMKRKLINTLGSSAPLVVTVANLAEGSYDLEVEPLIDQYLFMMYDFHFPFNGIGSVGSEYDVTGFNAPLGRPDSALYPMLNQASLNYDGRRPADPRLTGPNKFVEMGFPRSKIGVGIPFYGYRFNGRTAPNQPRDGVWPQYISYVDVLIAPGTRHFEIVSSSPWIGGDDFFITYSDTVFVRKAVEWTKSNGFGGMMIYELWNGWIASAPQGQKDPLLRALIDALNVNSSTSQGTQVPDQFHLRNNFPNPFNPSTTIRFELPVSAHVRLEIFDVLGRQVETLRDEKMDPGVFDIKWSPKDLPSGVYIYRFAAGEVLRSGKMLLLK
ncbi:MAG: Cytochrome [Bacteroidetes bacterium]|nr:Cytochrome [Bacteroidota bacterium]